jgi:hypothetical protein
MVLVVFLVFGPGLRNEDIHDDNRSTESPREK